jgi:hypothetical protein
MPAAVIPHGDAAPVLEPAEHDLDAVALAAEYGVVGQRRVAAAVGGMQGVMPRSSRAVNRHVACRFTPKRSILSTGPAKSG